MTQELWNPIPSLRGEFHASSLGRIKRVRGGRMMMMSMRRGYLIVNLDGKTRLAHRLIAEAFLGPIPEGQVVRHINCVAHDNRVENLCYGTAFDNATDSIKDRRLRLGLDAHVPEGQIKSVTLYERAPGVWRVRSELATANSGRKFVTETVYGTAEDAQNRRNQLLFAGNG
jgi:hypothetical protein